MAALVVGALIAANPSGAQETPVPAPKVTTANEIFSGTIREMGPDFVLVERKVAGKETVTQRFTLDAQTRVEGVLKLRARVTVQFQSGDDETMTAVHIIVRS